MPSSLIELGYLSNKNEAQLLSTPQYQKQMAQSLYSGLIKYKEFIDKTPANNLD